MWTAHIHRQIGSTRKRLTALVSAYNSGEWIENRLVNLLASSIGTDLEIFVYNANSPDERDDTIPRKFGDKITYVKSPTRNTVYEAWNWMIQNSQSEFLTNANTDDLVAPHCYETLIGVLENSGQEFGFSYASWFTTAIPNQQWAALISLDRSGRPGHYHGDIDKSGIGHFPLWRRNLHDKVGLFDTTFKAASDADFWARCYFMGGTEFRWVDDFLACYLWRDGENLWHQVITSEEWQRYHTNVAKYKREGVRSS